MCVPRLVRAPEFEPMVLWVVVGRLVRTPPPQKKIRWFKPDDHTK
jgi:hypothetical protein